MSNDFGITYSVHWGIKHPLKNYPLFLAKPPPPPTLKSANCPSPSILGNRPPRYWFFMNPSLKVGFFSEPPKYQSFSSSIPSYLLKVTKFLGKISQFPISEFLVITKKNVFAYKLFSSLNILHFNLL